LCTLGLLYGIGSWVGDIILITKNNPVYNKNNNWDQIKTTQEGFLEVSKILSDPKTTNNPPISSFDSGDQIDIPILTSDLYSSKWIRTVPDICLQKKTNIILILTIVISAPKNFEERHAIRQGWGKMASKMPKSALIFLVGTNELLVQLEAESDTYGDVAITDTVDTYQNLTLKTLAAFDWMRQYCPQAQYLLKTDDDMFIQVIYI
jgi:hypothetical protein